METIFQFSRSTRCKGSVTNATFLAMLGISPVFVKLLSSYREFFFKKAPSRTEPCKMDGVIVRFETKISAIGEHTRDK